MDSLKDRLITFSFIRQNKLPDGNSISRQYVRKFVRFINKLLLKDGEASSVLTFELHNTEIKEGKTVDNITFSTPSIEIKNRIKPELERQLKELGYL